MRLLLLPIAAAAAVGMLVVFFSKNDFEGRRRLSFDPKTTVLKPPMEYLWNGENIYYQTAMASDRITDKVTRYSYQTMYGRFLLPYYYKYPSMKMLEIGLGCPVSLDPGRSASLHKTLFPQAELWVADNVKRCMNKYRINEISKGVNLLLGDQGDYATIDRWLITSGGNFDVVIDDGGRQNCQSWNSFQKLWPAVKPGGLYFIEDMEAANKQRQPQGPCGSDLVVPEKLKEMFNVLIYEELGQLRRESDIKFIFCQADACVLGKKSGADPASVWWNNA